MERILHNLSNSGHKYLQCRFLDSAFSKKTAMNGNAKLLTQLHDARYSWRN